MNQEERDLIARFVARVSGQTQPAASGGAWGASVPATTAPALPPIDPEADAFIKENFQRYPEAPYRITQTAVVQEAALAEAQNRIRRLEWELQRARAQAAQPQQRSAGLFGGLFGGGNRAQQPPPNYGPQGYPQQGYPQQGYQQPPQQAYPPGYNPGMFQQRGSGFLGSALTTAAGVAGGMVAGNAIMDLFEGHHGGGFGGEYGGGETIINNNYGDAAAGGAGGDPWGGAGTGADAYDQGGGFDNAPADTGSFDTGGTFDGGGWDDNSF